MIKFQKINETYGKLETLDNQEFFEIKDYLSFHPEGYKFNKKYRMGLWQGKVQLLGMNGEFPLGLLKTILKFCLDNKYQVQISDTLKQQKAFESREEFDQWIQSKNIYGKEGQKIDPYWYQKDSVFDALQKRRAIINAPTSAGKQLIISLLSKWYSENYDKKILIIVPTTALTVQMKNDFIDYTLFKESEIAEIRSGTSHFIYDKKVVVSTWQSAHKKDKDWLDQFGMLIVDECHLSTGMQITQMTSSLTNCQFKYGLSGSLKDGKANILNYVGLFGDIIRLVSTKKLMEDGQVSKLKIKCIKLNYSDSERNENKKISYDDEIKFITNHEKRIKLVQKLAIGTVDKEIPENTLVMFRYTDHGKKLYQEIIKNYDKNKVFYIDGDIKTEDRVKIQKIVDNSDGIIVVAQYATTGTGINIKNLHNAIFASPIKSKVTVLQTIGRTLRLHKSKEFAVVFDIIDDLSIRSKKSNKITHKNFQLSHGIDRIKRYNEENFEYSLSEFDLK